MSLRIDDFDYLLPKELIAQHPEKERASSRLLVLHRKEGEVEHRKFSGIADYFAGGDVLVLNDSKVFPARLKAVKETGGAVDVLLVERKSPRRWGCLAQGAKRGVRQQRVSVGSWYADLLRDEEKGAWEIEFLYDGDSFDIINKCGVMPLPGYIKRKGAQEPEDFTRYQTVYADPVGSIAAPTAGFHFTEDLLEKLESKGVHIVKITLHVGIGTFSLIKAEKVEDHSMHREYYSFSPGTRAALLLAKEQGRRIIACGTSAVRTVETLFSRKGDMPSTGYTDLFIYPGFSFKAVDGMITNFHLPRSTPLLLAAAFAGRDALKRAYADAIEQGYRFYSYGDAMLIL
ncbi:MAG TPA: tRNA preQ1(34) S-adenosylmethionine ribosyltransferase-isomerase QueA [Syntrophorhabdaceae bacterium]|jgi:S-adenosylmethionine:tRNA ribosyltransferase-isomerase